MEERWEYFREPAVCKYPTQSDSLNSTMLSKLFITSLLGIDTRPDNKKSWILYLLHKINFRNLLTCRDLFWPVTVAGPSPFTITDENNWRSRNSRWNDISRAIRGTILTAFGCSSRFSIMMITDPAHQRTRSGRRFSLN